MTPSWSWPSRKTVAPIGEVLSRQGLCRETGLPSTTGCTAVMGNPTEAKSVGYVRFSCLDLDAELGRGSARYLSQARR